MDEHLAAIERAEVAGLRIAETNDAEKLVRRRIGDGNRIGELLGGINAIAMADRHIGVAGRTRRLTGRGRGDRDDSGTGEQSEGKHRVLHLNAPRPAMSGTYPSRSEE